MRRSVAIALSVVVSASMFSIALLSACGHEAQPAAAATERAAPAMTRDHGHIVIPEGSTLRDRIVIEALEARPVRRALEVPAHVEADPSRVARITPPLPGRIVTLAVHFGDEVSQGDTLLTIDSPDLAQAQSDHLDAEAALAQATRNQTRAQDLYDHRILALADLENARTQFQVATAELERTSSRLRLLGVRGAAIGRPLTVRAPIAGRVVELQVSVGEFHSDLSVPLMTIADLSTVWISASVQERDLSRVTLGMQVTAVLAAYPDAPVTGAVLYIGDLLDPETRTLPIRIAFENAEHRLHPGMFATVTFEETARPEIVVPASAVVLRGDHNVVFVEIPPAGSWTFEEREVTLGPPVGDDLVVTQHLAPGDRVVVTQAIQLQ